MPRLSRLAALGLTALALAPLDARANPPSVTVTSPFYPPVYQSPLPSTPHWANPYWAQPYWAHQAAPSVTMYPSGSPNLPPQLTNPAANPYPMGKAGQGSIGDSRWKASGGAQTCVAPPYACPAPAPNTPGHSCTCPTNQEGETVTGTVH